jgi:hypothetical protein
MFWIDSDMVWSPEAFMRMLALSTVVSVAVGAYSAKEEPLRFHGIGTPGRVTQNEYGCIPCTSGGLGFTIVDRKVIETLALDAPQIKLDYGDLKDQPIPHLFREDVNAAGYFLGEDTAFFADVKAAGFEMWCDPTITLGHIGSKVYEGSLHDDYVARLEAAE